MPRPTYKQNAKGQGQHAVGHRPGKGGPDGSTATPLRMRKGMEIHSPFSINDCKQKLAAAIDDTRLFLDGSVADGKKEMVGRIFENSFRIQARPSGFNSFRPILYAQLVSEDSGTRIVGKFRWHPLTRVLTIIWFSGITFFSVASTVEIFALRLKNIPSNLFIPYFMLLLAVLSIRPGTANLEARETIIRFVSNVTTQGRAQPAATAVSAGALRRWL